MSLTETGTPDPHASRRIRVLVGACSGNAVEWYDFAVYGAFASVLAGQFFPSGSDAALAATFAIFATSFVARPVGAAVLGRRADRLGRRPVFSLMVMLMSVATAAIGVLPTWSSVGFLAPVLLLVLRLVQGFSSGGELPSSVVFLIESAPSGRRGWFGGWHLASIALGVTGGYGAVALLSAVLSDEALATWGWRVAFVVAAPLGLVGRFIRRRLDETRAFTSIAAHRTPRLADVFRGRGAAARRGFVLVALLALTFNIWFVFLPSYMVATGSTTLVRALSLCVVGLCAAVGTAPVMGGLSDRVGRRPVLVAATLGLATFAIPGYALAGSGSMIGILVSNLVMGVLVGSLAVSAFVAELFPAEVRVSGTAITYGFATALLGGSAPLIATVLTGLHAAWAVPAYVAVIAVLALAAALRAEETAFGELG